MAPCLAHYDRPNSPEPDISSETIRQDSARFHASAVERAASTFFLRRLKPITPNAKPTNASDVGSGTAKMKAWLSDSNALFVDANVIVVIVSPGAANAFKYLEND